jgi:hypothetical protein
VVSQRRPQVADYALASLPVFGAALLLYARTLLPDVGVWDTAEFQAIGPVLGTAHPTGYPTYTLLAWLASVLLQPFGNEAYRADLLSALLMAGAAALLAVRVVQATRRWTLGIVAGVTFAVTPVAWNWGLRADPHALHVFLAALILVLLAGWQERHGQPGRHAARWLLAAAIVYGLSLGNHALTLLLAPGVAAYVLMVAPRILRKEWRLVLACAAAIALSAALVYLYLPLRAAMDPALEYADPDTWERFWYVVLGGQFRGSVGALPSLLDMTASIWDQLVLSLGLLSALAVAGAILGFARHPRLTVLGALWFGCTWIFAIGYTNAAIERYYLVPLLVAALWVALAAEAILDALRASLPQPSRELRAGSSRAGRPRLYGLAASVLIVALLALAVAPVAERYDDIDASNETWGRNIIETTFEALDDDAVVVSWWSFSTPLWYGQHVEGRRPDVTVVDDRDFLDDGYTDSMGAVDAFVGNRPVYVIRLERELRALEERYELERVDGVPIDLYRVVGPREAE